MTRAGGATIAPAKTERSERPKPERSERPSANNSNAAAVTDRGSAVRAMEEFPDSAGGARSPMAAPRAGSNSRPAPSSRPSAKATDDDDDFGDTDVGSLLM